jgi:hypothetical protein
MQGNVIGKPVNVFVSMDIQGVHVNEVRTIFSCDIACFYRLFAGKCPNSCSGHGICSTLKDISLYNGPDYDTQTAVRGDGLGYNYNNWDANSIQLCECDAGYFGSDCSLGKKILFTFTLYMQGYPSSNLFSRIAMCPKGDDPLTLNQNVRKVMMHVQSGSRSFLYGKVGMQFQGTVTYIPLEDITDKFCTSLISNQGKFGDVQCEVTRLSRFIMRYYFTFYNWPLYPKDNNLYANNGNPGLSEFFCDNSYASPGAYCVFVDIESTNIQGK